jgi:hypothetical protein
MNDEWQSAIENLCLKDGRFEETTQLANLSRNFVAVSQTYARIIVRELHYPNERKVIKPVDLGGLIGGEKYICSGILFKGLKKGKWFWSFLFVWFFLLLLVFPQVVKPGMFRDEEPSQKIAGHELKSLTAFFNVNQIFNIGFALPMIAVIDILGHRLIALALCPINSDTLVHGENGNCWCVFCFLS